jgi:hypothetical protein
MRDLIILSFLLIVIFGGAGWIKLMLWERKEDT